jgi:hypothetical protein
MKQFNFLPSYVGEQTQIRSVIAVDERGEKPLLPYIAFGLIPLLLKQRKTHGKK